MFICFMKNALDMARTAHSETQDNKHSPENEVPVGAVIVQKGKVIASAHNLVRTTCDPTAHAEIVAIRAAAAALNTTHLVDCDIYVTLEPCAYDMKGGAIENGAKVLNHSHTKIEVYGGIGEIEANILLVEFFKKRRQMNQFSNGFA